MGNSSVDPENDPRPRMKILRLLLAGGLMTRERHHRHRRKQGKVLCFTRGRALNVLPEPLNQLPVCFRYATIVSVDLYIDQSALVIIQTT